MYSLLFRPQNLGVKFLLLTYLTYLSIAPPVEQKKDEVTTTLSPEQMAYNVEYERYLQEVVQSLESDDDFRKKIEQAHPDDIKSGKIAEHLDFLNGTIRSKLDEIKRQEVERLEKLSRLNDPNSIEHFDHTNLLSFGKEDLRKLIRKATIDLEEADKRRKQEFKLYEMEKEYQKQEKLSKLSADEKEKFQQEQQLLKKKHADHPPVKHPMSKAQLEEVWEKVDKLAENLNLSTQFDLHDFNADGKLSEEELMALFNRELDKVYNSANPEDDMREKEEELNRMREHVLNELDADKDRFLDKNEFLASEKKTESEKDWQTLDQQDDPVFTNQEFNVYKEQRDKGVEPLQIIF